MHRVSYHQNDHGTRASHLYDGDDKTHGATAAPSTDEEYLNSHATRRNNSEGRMRMHASCRQGRPAQERGSKLQENEEEELMRK